MASPISVDEFIKATQNEIFNVSEDCRERIALDLGVRVEQIQVSSDSIPLRFTLVQPGNKAIHLDYYDPNRKPHVK